MADDFIHEGARLLARWLALELLIANEDQIVQGLRENNLPARLGVPILDAHRRYRDALPEDIASGTDYFKQALNEIIAGGRKVF